MHLLNSRIKVQTPGVRTETDLGGYTYASPTESEIWASVKYLNQRESLLYGVEVGDMTTQFIIRKDAAPNIGQECKIIFNGRSWRITSALPDTNNPEYVTILAVSQTN